MAGQIRSNRQRELFIKKSTRVAASYLNRAMTLSEIPDAARPFFGTLENTFVKLRGISSLLGTIYFIRNAYFIGFFNVSRETFILIYTNFSAEWFLFCP